jgi:hypothetical protein
MKTKLLETFPLHIQITAPVSHIPWRDMVSRIKTEFETRNIPVPWMDQATTWLHLLQKTKDVYYKNQNQDIMGLFWSAFHNFLAKNSRRTQFNTNKLLNQLGLNADDTIAEILTPITNTIPHNGFRFTDKLDWDTRMDRISCYYDHRNPTAIPLIFAMGGLALVTTANNRIFFVPSSNPNIIQWFSSSVQPYGEKDRIFGHLTTALGWQFHELYFTYPKSINKYIYDSQGGLLYVPDTDLDQAKIFTSTFSETELVDIIKTIQSKK